MSDSPYITIPGIEFLPPHPQRQEWQVNIDHGPGHHGRGLTPADALFNAAKAWKAWEFKQNAKLIKRKTT